MSTPKEILEQCNVFFVYGTLKMGLHNHHFIRGEQFLSDAVTVDNFYMVGSGIPYLLKGDGFSRFPVKGEAYRFSSEETLIDVDRLEGEGHFYHRRLIKIELLETSEQVDAWAYMVDATKYPYPHLTNDLIQEW